MFFLLSVLLSMPLQGSTPVPEKQDPLERETESFRKSWINQGGSRIRFQPVPKKMTSQMKRDLVHAAYKRLLAAGYKNARVSLTPKDLFTVQVAGVPEKKNEKVRDLFRFSGEIEEREVASREIHEGWDGSPKNIPKGWFAIENDRKMAGEYDYLGGDSLLVSNDLILTGTDILKVRKEKSTYSGGWSIYFVLTKEAADRFDRTAKKLYNQNPRGLSAIIVDGKIISKPVINAEKFGGAGVITGSFSEGEATGLVLALKQKPLPCLLKFHDQKRFGPSD